MPTDILDSPIRHEALGLLKHGGAMSVRELAVAMGRNPRGLYYHLRLLARAGYLAEESKPSPSNGIREVSFRLNADAPSLDGAVVAAAGLPGGHRRMRSNLRVIERQHLRLTEQLENGKAAPEQCFAFAGQVRLSKSAYREALKRFAALEDFLRTHGGAGEAYAFLGTILKVSPKSRRASG